MQQKYSATRRETALLALVLLIGLTLRLWGLGFGLPYLYHPDEPNKIEMAQNMFKTGDLNPHYFLKPTTFIYLNALTYVPYYLFGRLNGSLKSPQDIAAPTMLALGVGITTMPNTILMGRLLTVLFGLLSILLAFLLGRRIYNSGAVGLLAAFILATSPTCVNNSRYITENSFLVAAILAVAWFALDTYERGRLRDYALAGILTGIAVSFKYPGVITIVLVLAAHFLRKGWAGLKDYRLYTALALVPIAFLVGTPFALFDFPKFLEDTVFEFQHYRTGHAGMEGNAFGWYLAYALSTEGIVTIVAIAEIIGGFWRGHKQAILLSTFPIVYFTFISSFTVRNDRTLLPLIPFLAIFAAALLVRCFERLLEREAGALRAVTLAATAIITFTTLGLPTYNSIRDAIQLNNLDSRETAALWIETNLQAGSKIAIEPYSPYVDPERFLVEGTTRMIEHSPDWYRANGFEYLIFGQQMFGRFYAEPEKYSTEIALYDELFGSFDLVKRFTDGNYEVRIYEVKD